MKLVFDQVQFPMFELAKQIILSFFTLCWFFITYITLLFRKLFSAIDRFSDKPFCGKWTKYHSFRKSHQQIYKQHYFQKRKSKELTYKELRMKK